MALHTAQPKAILLDMDDTIIAFSHGVDTDECWRTAIREHVQEIDAAGVERLLAAIKGRAAWYWSDPERHKVGRMDLFQARQEFVSAALAANGIHGDQELVVGISRAYGEERDKAVSLFPDSIDTIKQLRNKGIKLALMTNGNAKTQWEKIEKFELAPLFDFVFVEGDLGFGKPDERIYLHAMERLEVEAEETWMVGDNFDWEVAAPQRLGIKGIWVDHNNSGIPAGSSARPFRIIRTLSELLTL